MENDIFDSLEDLGYDGEFLDECHFNSSVCDGMINTKFTLFIEWLTSELASFARINEHVSSITDLSDSESFLMELSGFIRECGCPYSCLTEGQIDQRFWSRTNKLLLINYLITELQAARITVLKNHEKPENMQNWASNMQTCSSSNMAGMLKQMMIAINIPKPPDNLSTGLLFEKMNLKIKDLLCQVSKTTISPPLLKCALSDQQWTHVELVSKALHQDYEYRRQMLLQRLDVTIQSFLWSEKLKHKSDQLLSVYYPIRRRMSAIVNIDISNLLAAREDILCIERTSCGTARERTRCDVNRVVMGAVPDRGGRPYEMGPPAPDMPSFQQRRGGGERGGGQYRGGRSRGGRYHR